MSEERLERFALGHKKGDKLSKTYEKYKIFERISRFLRTICSNHKRIIHIAHEQMSKVQTLKKIVFKFFLQ